MTAVSLLAGFVGSTIIGKIVDVTKKFKLITILNTTFMCVALALFTGLVSKGKESLPGLAGTILALDNVLKLF